MPDPCSIAFLGARGIAFLPAPLPFWAPAALPFCLRRPGLSDKIEWF
jgi:hypothetical protein